MFRYYLNLSFQIIQNMNLFILRDREAGKFSDGNDFFRPLTDAGATDVTRVAEWLKDLGVKFDAIITSPLKRAHQTASIVSKIFNIENNLIKSEELRPGRNRIEFYQKLSSEQLFKQESDVLVVGHEPFLSSLISEIISNANTSSHIVVKKAGPGQYTLLLNPVSCTTMCWTCVHT
jgi:phosphohistidine phosphatase